MKNRLRKTARSSSPAMRTLSASNLFETIGLIRPDGSFRQYGGVGPEDNVETFTIDLQFRLATNGVIVNTIVNGEPVITTSAANFNK